MKFIRLLDNKACFIYIKLLVKNKVLCEKFDTLLKLILEALYGKWAVLIQEEAKKVFSSGILYKKLALLI